MLYQRRRHIQRCQLFDIDRNVSATSTCLPLSQTRNRRLENTFPARVPGQASPSRGHLPARVPRPWGVVVLYGESSSSPSREHPFFAFLHYIQHTRPDPITKRISAVPSSKWRDWSYICDARDTYEHRPKKYRSIYDVPSLRKN